MSKRGRRTSEYNLFNDFGEQILHVVKEVPLGSLGKGWIAVYKRAIRQLIVECPSLATLKVYLFIASKETYKKGVFVAPKLVMSTLGLSERTFQRAVAWLREHEYMNRIEIDGVSAWIFNPAVNVCGGKSKPGKRDLWSLALKRDHAELVADVEHKKALVAALNELISANIVEGEEDDDDWESPASALEPAGGAVSPEKLRAEGDSALQGGDVQSVQVRSELDTRGSG